MWGAGERPEAASRDRPGRPNSDHQDEQEGKMKRAFSDYQIVGGPQMPSHIHSNEVGRCADRSQVGNVGCHRNQHQHRKHNQSGGDAASPLADAADFVLDVLLCKGRESSATGERTVTCDIWDGKHPCDLVNTHGLVTKRHLSPVTHLWSSQPRAAHTSATHECIQHECIQQQPNMCCMHQAACTHPRFVGRSARRDQRAAPGWTPASPAPAPHTTAGC